LPGARTTATSKMEGRLKSGALSKMKTKKRFSASMKPTGGTGAIKQKEILKSAKFGGASGSGAVTKGFSERKSAVGTPGAGMKSLGTVAGGTGTDRAAAMVAKVTNKLTQAKQKALGMKGKK